MAKKKQAKKEKEVKEEVIEDISQVSSPSEEQEKVDKDPVLFNLENEKRALDSNISKLGKFIANKEEFYKLSYLNRTLLDQQLRTMQKYSTILGKRIEIFVSLN